MPMQLTLSGLNLPIKTANKSIEFVKQMAVMEFYDIKDTKQHGVLDIPNHDFIADAKISSIEHIIKATPDRFMPTTTFGVIVSMPNGTYELTFIKHKKGCSLSGNCSITTDKCQFDRDKQSALNDYLWGIYVSEAIQSKYLPHITISDSTNYHKTKPNRETLREWRFNDTNRGTTFQRDFNNLEHHDLDNLVLGLGWSKSVITPPNNTNGQSARINLLKSTMAEQPDDYKHITHLKKLCDMVVANI